MKKRFLALLLLVCVALGAFGGCNPSAGGDSSSSSGHIEEIDYAGQVTLNMASETQKQEVTVKNYVDGDTTHFRVPTSIADDGVLKARYLAVNTPESTGKIEEWGKKAAKFTKEKLQSAEKIIIETDGIDWEVDSTGDRHLVWVWYLPEGETQYRNLNIEILQNGLAVGSKAGSTRYGAICTNAISQAKSLSLHVHSKEKDPDYCYDEAIELDLKELRTNIENYTGLKVAFEGVVSYYSNQGVYVEEYDPLTNMYYGMYVYYGYFLDSFGQRILSVGNRVRIVGSVQYYETGDSYQVSDLTYDLFHVDDPNNLQLLDEEKHEAAHVETTLETFKSTVTVEKEVYDEETEETTLVSEDYPYAKLALGTSIEMKNLVVSSMYTTAQGESEGAISITCKIGNQTIVVRTVPLKDADGKLIAEDYFEGKTIDVRGIVDYYNGSYQIKVFTLNNIVLH